jgi:hypothetical protein
MYLIRANTERPLLNIELSGHVTTDEAVRMLTLAAELIKTDKHRGVLCDVSALDYGPDRPATVAAVLAALLPVHLRVAVTGLAPTLRGVARITGLAHAGGSIRTFDSAAEAEDWLSEVVGTRTTLPATAQRHLQEMTSPTPTPDPAAAPARRTSAA